MSLKNVLAKIDICLPTLILLTHDTLISKFCFICDRHEGQKKKKKEIEIITDITLRKLRENSASAG